MGRSRQTQKRLPEFFAAAGGHFRSAVLIFRRRIREGTLFNRPFLCVKCTIFFCFKWENIVELLVFCLLNGLFEINSAAYGEKIPEKTKLFDGKLFHVPNMEVISMGIL